MQDLTHPDLPAEVEDAQAAERLAENIDRVIAFGEAMAKVRDEAIQHRRQSGIEDEWQEDENHYQGVDAANKGTGTYKPASLNGQFESVRSGSMTQSTLFLNITRPYADAAAARVADMIMPNDDFPFDYKPTPIANGKLDDQGVAQGSIDPQQIEALRKQYEDKAKGAKKQVQDWMVECQWHAEVRKFVKDMAHLGTGVMRGPFPVERTARCAVQSPTGGMVLEIEKKIAPAVRRVSPWNFYPGAGCGENFRDGSNCWERDSITARQLRELKSLGKDYGYLDHQIDKVLKEGPKKTLRDRGIETEVKDTATYEIWYGYALANREQLVAAGLDDSDIGDMDVAIPAEIVMVNDSVIKATLNPFKDGGFPYDMAVWQRREGMPWGMGVSRQINAPQRLVNAAARHMSDNAGFTAGPQTVIDQEVIEPAVGSDYTVTARKAWLKKAGFANVPIEDAFKVFNIPTMQQELLSIVQFGLKMAEDVTNLPMLMQGQQGAAPDTVGGMTILNNNATVVLRSVIRNIDDNLIEPQATRFYDWLMVYGEDDSIKGDYQIDAIGSTSMIERDMANTGLKELAPMSLNPAFGLDPELIAMELVKAHRIDPKRVTMAEDKKRKLAEQPPPEAPQVTAAKIRSQTELQKTERMAAVQERKIEVDTDRDAVYTQAEAERTRIEWEARNLDRQLEYQLAVLKYANDRQITLDQAKAELTKVSMQLNVQKQLSGTNAAEPAVEPAGRAPEGQAFQR